LDGGNHEILGAFEEEYGENDEENFSGVLHYVLETRGKFGGGVEQELGKRR